MILKKCVSTFSDKVKKIITNSTMITETKINSELFTSNSILVHNPITKNKLISFKRKRLDILIQIVAFPYIKTTLKLNYSLLKNHFCTKFMIQNMAYDIFIGISGKTLNKIQVLTH